MHTVKSMFVMLMCTMFLGCVSQQAHERAIEELKMTSQNSVQEVSQLQEANKDLEAAIEVQGQVEEQNLKAL
jgi:tRNA U54 and U55 pseudouridine synthase Pus10